jgi:hypothetical protein
VYSFEYYFNLLVNEDNIAGSGGALGTSGSPGVEASTDWYAPNDSRLPYVIGTFKRGKTKNKGLKKRKKGIKQ